jgi:hypothetical protein
MPSFSFAVVIEREITTVRLPQGVVGRKLPDRSHIYRGKLGSDLE